MTILMSMASVVGAKLKLHHILNSLCLATPYEGILRLKSKLIEQNVLNRRPVLTSVKPHGIAQCAVDNIESKNFQGLLVKWKRKKDLHMTGIQAVFSVNKLAEEDEVHIRELEKKKHLRLQYSNAFIDAQVFRQYTLIY